MSTRDTSQQGMPVSGDTVRRQSASAEPPQSGLAVPSGEHRHEAAPAPSSPAPGHGYVADKQKVAARLKRIEGQVRAITRMIEDDAYCIDVLTQISASDKALKSVALLLLDDHLNHCVRTAVTQGGVVADDKLREAEDAIARLVRS